MQGVRIEFEWTKFPDYQVEKRPGTPGSFISEACYDELVAGSPEAALKIKPLDLFPDLYLELAKAKPDGHREFAKKYGLLTDERHESTSVWPQLVQNMSNLVAKVADKGSWTIRNGAYDPYELSAKFKLRFGPTDADAKKTALSIVPANLYNALVLQCVSSSAGGAEVRSCRACGYLFEIGGTSGHRSNRDFCSDKCRFAYSHRSRRK